MRNRQIGVLGAFLFLVFCIYSLSRNPGSLPRPPKEPQPQEEKPPEPPRIVVPITWTEDENTKDTKPQPAPSGSHPIWYLTNKAEQEFEEVKARQSRTLKEAVAEYRKRYGIPPPPNFDKWWAFAKERDVQLVDEFDTVMELVTPFWGLKPSTIRARAREVIGFDDSLMGLQIRGGNISAMFKARTADWHQKGVTGMIEKFVEFLPDMDLPFNVNDESRVVLPHEDLSRLVRTALEVNLPALKAEKELRNSFTSRPTGLNYEGRFDEVKLTRFNTFAHQPTWTHSRISCPPDSPSRILEEDDQYDDREKYSLGELGFVTNWTALSDICLTPSLQSTFGFFDRPNAYSVVHDLVPVFSPSKISSYSDLIFPSPWYYSDKVPYDPSIDPPWEEKINRLYWRGSTTGGFSRNGGWRRQHRQRVVKKFNAVDNGKILTNVGSSSSPNWTMTSVPRGEFKSLLDVYFSHIGQCDPGDCTAQKEFFEIKEYAKQEDAFKYRHVLDLDGNAFSGRFHAFLKSKSLVFKYAIFKEWHFEWLRPWAHYIPMSLKGEEWLELVRYFGEETEGKREGERVAMQGREWGLKVLRGEDMEVWFFRLLLEYGRVVDDDRERIGFAV
ncbi:family 90 putative glycosyltransferase [Triangularia verruculosa]|uniref:Family 90 putative glycosyltransferase n=1 Tax=Triangularia verruculosa TaxID=2587418 RepID=A0AAN6XQE6_9PEZI|nr:family 90 putative glycosyltransferase [Triangularia verruculosa]